MVSECLKGLVNIVEGICVLCPFWKHWGELKSVQQQKLSPLMSLFSAEMQWFLGHVKCVDKEGHKALAIGTILRY